MTREIEAADYHIEVLDDLAQLDATEWNTLLAQQAAPTVFMRHEWLLALSQSGSAVAGTGWQPLVLVLRRAGTLQGAMPLYLKSHSYGEYVFDWAWADAYQRHGLRYYPKVLGAVPFTPVPGSRLLARDALARRLLLRGVRELAKNQGWSSAHLLFLDPQEQVAAQAEGWLMRQGVQFHWQNRAETPYRDWPDFLSSLHRDKRKKIQQERRRVAEAGIQFDVLEGPQISDADWDFFHHCYSLTYQAHRSTPYLTRAFFSQVQAHLPAHHLLFVACRGEGAERRRVACSLVAIDREQGVAWGRYWGATEAVDCLHFEACYYQPLAWCIAQGFKRFEGGAQGEHKMARGLLPTPTASAHWLAHPEFARAVEDFLQREGHGMSAYLDELKERNPFKSNPGAA